MSSSRRLSTARGSSSAPTTKKPPADSSEHPASFHMTDPTDGFDMGSDDPVHTDSDASPPPSPKSSSAPLLPSSSTASRPVKRPSKYPPDPSAHAYATKKSKNKGKGVNLVKQLRHSDPKTGVLHRDADNEGISREDPLPARPNFVIEMAMLVLLGLRPRRLQQHLLTQDPVKVWTSFRDSLVKRWGTLGTISGLMLAATGTATTEAQFTNAALNVPTTLAMLGRTSAIVALAFATGLALVFVDAAPKDFAKLARSPIHLVFVLSAPAFFAIVAMLFYYLTLLTTAWIQGSLIAKIGVTAGGVWTVFLISYCAYLVWRIADKDD